MCNASTFFLWFAWVLLTSFVPLLSCIVACIWGCIKHTINILNSIHLYSPMLYLSFTTLFSPLCTSIILSGIILPLLKFVLKFSFNTLKMPTAVFWLLSYYSTNESIFWLFSKLFSLSFGSWPLFQSDTCLMLQDEYINVRSIQCVNWVTGYECSRIQKAL